MGDRDALREEIARTLHDANTGKICPDPSDPTKYGAMASAALEIVEREVAAALKPRYPDSGYGCVCEHRPDGSCVESADCPDHGGSVAAIRAREAASIAGPWVPDYDWCDCGDGYGCGHPPWVHAVLTPVIITEPSPGSPVRDYHRQATEFGDFPVETGRFIAHARTDIPTLLAEVDRLRSAEFRARDNLRQAIADRLGLDRDADWPADDVMIRMLAEQRGTEESFGG